MIRHDAIVNVITDALSAYIKECCDESFQRGVERGRFEERCDESKRKEQDRRNAGK
jgi:hypothetical protein